MINNQNIIHQVIKMKEYIRIIIFQTKTHKLQFQKLSIVKLIKSQKNK